MMADDRRAENEVLEYYYYYDDHVIMYYMQYNILFVVVYVGNYGQRRLSIFPIANPSTAVAAAVSAAVDRVCGIKTKGRRRFWKNMIYIYENTIAYCLFVRSSIPEMYHYYIQNLTGNVAKFLNYTKILF